MQVVYVESKLALTIQNGFMEDSYWGFTKSRVDHLIGLGSLLYLMCAQALQMELHLI